MPIEQRSSMSRPSKETGRSQMGEGDFRRLLGSGFRWQAREHQGEFVAGEATDDQAATLGRFACRLGAVRGCRREVAERVLQPLADFYQHPVADLLAERIVQALEAVHVDQQNRRAVPGRSRLAQTGLPEFEKTGPAGKAGQLVAMSLLTHRAHTFLGDRGHVLDAVELQPAVRQCRLRLGRADEMEQALRQESPLQRLEKIVAYAALEGPVDHRFVVAPGQHHDRDLARGDQFTQATDGVEAIGVGQRVVEQYRIGAAASKYRQCLRQRIDDLNVDATLAKSDQNEVLPRRIVLNKQHLQACRSGSQQRICIQDATYVLIINRLPGAGQLSQGKS